MAVLSDYTSGTITLANGSTTVTGTGTMFQAAAFKAGDTLQIQNLTAVIASVNSNTSLTLTAPWTGTALTNAPYRARYLPDGARVTAQTTTLIELLGNGVLTNLAEIGVEEGKAPVGNAAGQYELANLVTDPSGSLAKLAALTLAARQILQTDETGALKTLALAANSFLRTDANGDMALSELGSAAVALLNLSGAAVADRMPYLNSANGAALTPLTPVARNLLDDTTVPSLRSTIGAGRSSFYASLVANTNVLNGTNNIPFNNVGQNIGNNWSGAVYTVPESGVYVFGVNYQVCDGTFNQGQCISQIFVGGGLLSENVVPKGTYYSSVATQTTAYFTAGSQVAFRIVLDGYGGAPFAQQGRTRVFGALIG